MNEIERREIQEAISAADTLVQKSRTFFRQK